MEIQRNKYFKSTNALMKLKELIKFKLIELKLLAKVLIGSPENSAGKTPINVF
jgi:hypothetical protein